jgi:probable HAF family extracellular repeat protein
MRRTVSRVVLACALVVALWVGAGPVSGQPASEQAVPEQRYSITDLGILRGGTFNRAYHINNRGQVVGQSDTASGASHAFLWERGKMTDLGTLPGEDQGGAWDINDRGQAVGWGDRHALLWSKRGVHQPGRFSATGRRLGGEGSQWLTLR